MLENNDATIKNGQSRDIDNVGDTIHRKNKCQRKPMGQSIMDNPEILATLPTQHTGQINVRKNRWDIHEWIIQRYWQGWPQKIQDKYMLEKTDETIKNGLSRDIGNVDHTRHRTNKCQRRPMGQSRMDNPEILATFGTQYTGQINVREDRWDNQEWTIQRYWQR